MVYARNSLAVIRSDRLVRKKYHPAPTELRMKFALRVLTISTTLNPVRERRAMAIDRLARILHERSAWVEFQREH